MVTAHRAQIIDINVSNLPGLLIWIGSVIWFIKEWR
jgi:hypothetical protein